MTYLLFTIALGQRPRAMGGHTVAETPIELPGKNDVSAVHHCPRPEAKGDGRRGYVPSLLVGRDGHTVAETPIELPGKNCKNCVLILASPCWPRKGDGDDFRRGQLERTPPKT